MSPGVLGFFLLSLGSFGWQFSTIIFLSLSFEMYHLPLGISPGLLFTNSLRYNVSASDTFYVSIPSGLWLLYKVSEQVNE